MKIFRRWAIRKIVAKNSTIHSPIFVLMYVSIQLKEEKRNALVGFLMIVIAVLFLLYMGSSLVHSTKVFWKNYSIGEDIRVIFLYFLCQIPAIFRHKIKK